MSAPDNLTILLITLNEQENIHRTLSQLQWADRIVIIDSGSNDETLSIINSFENTRVVHREFDSMANQWNFGLEQVTTDWVLTLDADYFVTEQLRLEILHALNSPDATGYMIPFRYCVAGKPLSASLLPPRCCLFQKGACHYFDDGHTQRLHVDGLKKSLLTPILHDDRKPLSRWLRNQDRYLLLEARKLTSTPFGTLSLPDKIRTLIFPAPLLVLLLCLIGKRCLLDGWRGWYYTLQRVLSEIILSLYLIELKIQPLSSDNMAE